MKLICRDTGFFIRCGIKGRGWFFGFRRINSYSRNASDIMYNFVWAEDTKAIYCGFTDFGYWKH